MTRPLKTRPPQLWDDLNRRMVEAATDPQRQAEAMALLQQACDRFPDQLAAIVIAWCDALAGAAGIDGYGPQTVTNVAVDYETVDQALAPRALAGREQWATEVLAARWAYDHARFTTLLRDAYADGSAAVKLPALLGLVGYNLRERAAGRYEGI